jgi:hypothetical protein
LRRKTTAGGLDARPDGPASTRSPEHGAMRPSRPVRVSCCVIYPFHDGPHAAAAVPNFHACAGSNLALRSSRGMFMPQYVIEREMPGVGKLGPSDLKMASQTSCNVIRDLGPEIQWVHSYVTDNKIYCVYRAPNEEMIREHARRGGFPANKISQIRAMIDPTTAE